MNQEKTAKNRSLLSKTYKWFWIADKCYEIYVYLKKKFGEHFEGIDVEDFI